MAQKEFDEFLSEFKELVNQGVLNTKSDFLLWLEEVKDECSFCFEDLSTTVNEYLQMKSIQ